jgi:hypothetical protein
MILVLHKELIKKGNSTVSALSKIFKEYWTVNLQTGWKTHFLSIFGFNVNDFYSSLSKYRLNMGEVLPDVFPKISEYSY